jgi:glycosyltransferase involved in cell wall biosynthesis
MTAMPTLTLFTPTYDRAHTLPRVFASLVRQTSRDFCWLVVDDGSTDSTRELVREWQSIADFDVEYLYQPNSGKHNAHNAAVSKALTELFCIVDSDDELLPQAVERITGAWNGATAADRARLAGIWTLCADPDGGIVDGAFSQDVIDATLQELYYGQGMNKEMLPTFVTEVLRAYPFPSTPPGACPYIPEGYVWMHITRSRPLRFLNVPCRVYHRADGLNVMGREEYRLSRCIVYGYLGPVAHDLDWFWSRPGLFLLCAIQAARYAIFSGQFRTLLRPLTWPAKAFLLGAAPLALLLLARDHVTGRIAKQLRPAHQRSCAS